MVTKKIFFVLFALLLGTVFLVNVSANGQKEGAGDGNIDELVVSFLTFGEVPADLQLVEDAVNEIVTPEIGVKVKLMFVNFGAAMQQYNLMLAAGEKLDLMLTFPYTYGQYVAKGYIQEITPYIDQYGSSIKDALGGYIEGSYVDGKLYGVRPLSDLASGTCLILRKDIVDKYNIDTTGIESYEDIEKILAVIKEADPSATPLGPANASSSMLEIVQQVTIDRLTDGFGSLLDYGQTLEVENWYASDTYRKYLDINRDWYQKGYILPDAATTKEDQYTLVKTGRIYGYVTTSKPGLEQQEANGCGTEVVAIDITKPFASTNTVQVFQWVVPNSCEAPEKAVQLLNMMYTSADLANLLAWGIEGVHYKVMDNGLATFADGVNNETSGYNHHSAWMVGNEFNAYVWEGNPPDLWEQTKEWNNNAILSKAMGFTFKQEPVKTEIAALNNVLEQYKKALDSGSVDPDKVLPEFLKKLEASGINEVIAEKQRQLDAWAATK